MPGSIAAPDRDLFRILVPGWIGESGPGAKESSVVLVPAVKLAPLD
jgi:hypothetical protein